MTEGVRFGLAAVKNVGEGAILSMLGVRREFGRIDSLYTLCEHADLRLVNKRVLESLVKAGALDSVPCGGERSVRGRRACLFAAVDRAIENGGRHQRDRDKGQSQLFGAMSDDGPEPPVALPDAPPWTEAQQLAYEKEALGFYMSGHPLERYAQEMKVFGARRLAELTASEADIWVGGIVAGVRPLKTKKGDRMAVFMLEDIAGSLEVVVFPETFARARIAHRDQTRCCSCAASSKKTTSRPASSPPSCMPIAALRERTTREVVIHLQSGHRRGRRSSSWRSCWTRHRGDRRVFLELDVKGQERALRVRSEVAQRVKPSERLVIEVEQLCGAGSVELR